MVTSCLLKVKSNLFDVNEAEKRHYSRNCSLKVTELSFVGPRVVNIEIPLSFDDEQNAEFDPVMINVHETLCHVREIYSRT